MTIQPDSQTAAGTGIGALCALLKNISTEALIETALLTLLGAVIGFIATELLKALKQYILRKIKKHKNE